MTTFRFITILLFLAFIAFYSCRKKCYDASNIDCENYDPCIGKKTINTYFKVRPGNNGFPPPPAWCDLVPTDTFNTSSVLFEVPEGNPENSTYEWRIGSEAEKRTGKKFEVDFSQYLNAGKWETYIPVTITIRTPMNNCMQNKEDTIKMVTRELFFTEKILQIMKPDEKQVTYKGYFNNNPEKETHFQNVLLEDKSFRGIKPPILLVVGLPNIDTLAVPRNCIVEGCSNYIHSRQKALHPNLCMPEVSKYFSEVEWILLDGIKRIKVIYKFSPPSGTERYEFIGERI